MQLQKAKPWPKKDLEGVWLFTKKIDGVQCIFDGKEWLSRAGKPLYNLPLDVDPGIYECFINDWNTTVGAVRTKNGYPIQPEYLFRLHPGIDQRLAMHILHNPRKDQILAIFKQQVEQGHEGLVLYGDADRYKVKGRDTIDVRVTGWNEGTGRNKGRLGALVTDFGNVSAGFTDEQRDLFTQEFIVGKIIEVDYMEMTVNDKMRHARFIRLREDK